MAFDVQFRVDFTMPTPTNDPDPTLTLGTNGHDTITITASQNAPNTVIVSDGLHSYELSISDLNSLTIDAQGGDDIFILDNTGGGGNISLPGGIHFVSSGGDNTLVVHGGAYLFTHDAGADASNLTIRAENGAVITFDASQHLHSLVLDAGTSASVTAGMDKTIVLNYLTLATDNGGHPLALLDLADNPMIVQNADSTAAAATLNQLVGFWLYAKANNKSAGVMSSLLVAGTTLAVVNNGCLNRTMWAGETVDANAILITRALSGDANLDGVVDMDDQMILAGHWQGSNKTWAQGDFTYDGSVDMDDLVTLSGNWQKTLAMPIWN